MLFGYKFYSKCKRVKPLEADFYTGKDIIDKEEEEYLRVQAARPHGSGKLEKIYDKTIGLIF
jgi:amino acid transporter